MLSSPHLSSWPRRSSLRLPKPPSRPADLIVVNGRVITVDSQFSIAEAAANPDGRFVAVGPNAEIKKRMGEATRVIDAQGKAVVPGLIETHVHAISGARAEAVQPFVQLSSIAEVQQWVRTQAETASREEWILIPRIDLTRLREQALRMLTLDAAYLGLMRKGKAPSRPANWGTSPFSPTTS